MVLQDRWSIMVVVSQDRFHCTLHFVMLGYLMCEIIIMEL